jgi:predicted enzyme related to lactoylglutathione lyase
MDLLVNVDVDDLELAVRFYTAGLDFRVGRRLGADVVEMVGASAPIFLLRKAAGTLAATESAQVRDYARHWTPVHLDFVVPDIGVAVERALKAGASLEQEPQASGWGKLAILADPFGHGFCFVEFIARGYDEGL